MQARPPPPAGWWGSAQRLLDCKGVCAAWVGLVAGCFGGETGADLKSQQLASTFQRKGKVVGIGVVLGVWAGDVARV